jgi:hypothetical protein
LCYEWPLFTRREDDQRDATSLKVPGSCKIAPLKSMGRVPLLRTVFLVYLPCL